MMGSENKMKCYKIFQGHDSRHGKSEQSELDQFDDEYDDEFEDGNQQ